MPGGVEKTYSFVGYTLDLRRGFLLSNDHQIDLRPKSFAVLRFLVENAGRLIPKDEIVQAIWPNVAVTDESLARCISDVRLALADGEQRIIKTVPRRGYLFAAPLSEPSVTAESPRPMAQSTGQQEQARNGAEARRSAERRLITAMRCEVVGLASLSMRLDPEDLRAVTIACHRHCTAIVRQHQGYVAHHLSGGLLVYFGYPDAHENDSEDAVRAGLALVESGATLAARHGADLRLQVGIASGLVVIGDELAPGTTARMVVGETLTLASLLQGVAQAGTLVISPTTRRLVSRLFEYRDLGWVALTSSAEPVRAWQVLGPSAIESRFEALRTGVIPLVGRDEELHLLMRRWEQAKYGHGSVVMITGEPGIGKSRLVQTLQERIAAEPHIRLQYFCSPHHQDVMLYPAITQLERAAAFRREDGPEQRLAKLEVVLAQATNELTEAVPLLAGLLSIPTASRYPPLNLTPQKRKDKTLRTLLAQLEGLAAREPVLVVFEGLHWSDPTTRESLDLTIDRLPGLRVLLVLTFRPEFAPPWIGRAHATLLSLSRLAPEQSNEMIAGVTGGKRLAEDITQQIAERADGVPLFIEELTKAVMESGALSDAGEAMGPQLAIPTTLHSSLLARLDRLGNARDVAQIAAALGRRFTYELISAVAAMPQSQVDDALVQLVHAELVFCRGNPPDAHYTFKHALVRDVAYACLLRDRRREIHARIAATLESRFPELSAAQPQLVARHYAEAGLNEKALDYWLKAGRQALAHSKMTEATAQLQKALDLLGTLPDTPERRHQELDLQVARCQAVIALQGYAAPLVGRTLARARQLCEHIGSPPQLAYVLWAQVLHEVVKGEVEPALGHAEEMEHLGEARRDIPVLATGVRLGGNVCFWRGDFAAANAKLGQTLTLFDAAHRPLYARLTGLDDHYVSALIYSFRTLSALGHLDQARLRCDTALVEARRLSHPYPLVNALCHASYGDWGLQPTHVLLERAEEADALCTEHGFLLWLAAARVTRGWCVAALGRVDEGIAVLTEGITLARRLSSPLQVPFALTLLADTYRRAMAPQQGMKWLDDALDTIETTRARWPEAEVHRVRAELLMSLQRHDEAEASFATALAVARRQSAKLWELRAATGIARLWRDQGKRDKARDMLAPIQGWFTEGFDTPDLREARALLKDLAPGA